MSKLRRFLGDLDAATDKRFEEHFIESRDLAHIHSSHSDIVYGSKGVGKTALRRALTEIHRDSFYTTKTIDLDQLSFSDLHYALTDLKKSSSPPISVLNTTEMPTPPGEVATLARNTWLNVLALYGLEAVAECLPSDHHLRDRIIQMLREEGFTGSDSTSRILGYIEQILLKFAEIAFEDDAPPRVSLTRRLRSVAHEFPSNPGVHDLLVECAALTKESEKLVLVCLDGFDSIVDHTPEARRSIFAGLIDAIHKCARDPLLSSVFCFKAFLPQELTDPAHSIVWDADKFVDHTHYLRWSERDFQRFLWTRLFPYAKTKSNHFNDVWLEFMPDKVRNDCHRIDEPSFNYILRHTLYRPRQLLTQLQRILDGWDEISDKFRVDPTFVVPAVAKTNYILAGSVVSQLGVTYPKLSTFMQSWSGTPNVVPFSEFQERMKRICELQTVQEIDDLLDALFNAGVIGIAKKGSLSKGTTNSKFRFGFVGDRMAPNIHASMETGDLLAWSPMFHEYCGCTASEYGAIIPTV